MSDQRCPIFLAPVVDPHCCQGCNKPLIGRQQRWCGESCWRPYADHHNWSSARRMALERASVYVDGMQLWVICDNCGRNCLDSDRDADPEVNHVEPRVGANISHSCFNHQTNLQVLCHHCHVEETNRQAAVRRAGPTQPLWASA